MISVVIPAVLVLNGRLREFFVWNIVKARYIYGMKPAVERLNFKASLGERAHPTDFAEVEMKVVTAGFSLIVSQNLFKNLTNHRKARWIMVMLMKVSDDAGHARSFHVTQEESPMR